MMEAANDPEDEDMEAVDVLPEEIWRRILSYLPDYQLAKLAPVSRLFRDLVFSVGFRQCGADEGANLGHDFLLWHDPHLDFLRRVPLKRLEFKLSKECIPRDGIYPVLPLGIGRFNTIPTEDRSLNERIKMVQTVEACPELEKLKVVHRSYERFGGPGRPAISNASSTRFSWVNDCPTATADFIDRILHPVQNAIKHLDLDLQCSCVVPPSEQEKGGHSLFGPLQVTPICACTGLTSLTLGNCIDGRAFELLAKSFKFLETLCLSNCECLLGSELRVVSDRIAEGALSKLKSLRLRRLDSSNVRDADLNDFFTSVPTWSGVLTSLSIGFSMFGRSTMFDLNPIFLVSVQLRQLDLHAPFASVPDFEALETLTNLNLRIKAGAVHSLWHEEPLQGPPPAPAPWNKIRPLTSLTINIDNLPPLATSMHDWQRCFGQLRSLCLGGLGLPDAFMYVKKILSVCGSSLKRFEMSSSLRGAEPLEVTNETDFQFTSLNLRDGGAVLWQNLPSSSFRFLTHFEFNEFDEDSRRVEAFILRVCEAAASSLRHLKSNCRLPLQILPEFARFKKLETLKVCFYDDYGSVDDFVRICNSTFPVVRINDSAFIDELSQFPALRNFDIRLQIGTKGWLLRHEAASYALRKTCFGKIERFLRLPTPARTYLTISPSDVARNTISLDGRIV